MPIPPSLLNRPGALITIAARTGQEHALGAQLGIDRTTVVELIDDLEKQGVVERRRNPADRRSYALHLTAKGRTVQKRATKAFDAAVDEFFGPLTSAERKALADMLTRMILKAQAKLA